MLIFAHPQIAVSTASSNAMSGCRPRLDRGI